MNEQFLNYIWFQKLFYEQQQTTDGLAVRIIDTGLPNHDAGPDVFNAKIKIGDTVWAGNVEFHVHASDWKLHGHESDKNYDSVILHVVAENDAKVYRTNGKPIPQLVLKFPEYILQHYDELIQSNTFIPCEKDFSRIDEMTLSMFMERLAIERLESKTDAIEILLNASANDWDETFYVMLARNFGLSTNADAFETLAKSLPQTFIAKHKDNLLQVEAMLLGQAGFLADKPCDEYTELLQREYKFLSAKFNLKPMDKSAWKLLRLRPANFPTVRIAQFAALAHQSTRLFSKIVEIKNIKDLQALFACEPSDYWQTHYLLGKKSAKRTKRLTASTINLLLINTVIPFLFSYGKHIEDEDIQNRALKFLQDIPAEKNNIVSGFADLGVSVNSAYETQSFIQLKKRYCDKKDCLRCRVGHVVLSKK